MDVFDGEAAAEMSAGEDPDQRRGGTQLKKWKNQNSNSCISVKFTLSLNKDKGRLRRNKMMKCYRSKICNKIENHKKNSFSNGKNIDAQFSILKINSKHRL